MSNIIRIAVKDLRLLRRDKIGLFWIFVFPLVFAVFFGMLTGGGGKGAGNISLVVVDEDDSSGSRAFTDRLKKSDALKVTTATRDDAVSQVRQGKAAAYVAIPKGYGDSEDQLFINDRPLVVGIDPARRAEAGLLQGVLIEATFAGFQEMFTNPEASRQRVRVALARIEQGPFGETEQGQLLRLFLGNFEKYLDKVEQAISPEAG